MDKRKKEKPKVLYSNIETERFLIFCKGTNKYIIKIYLEKKDGYLLKYDPMSNNSNDLNFKNSRLCQKKMLKQKTTIYCQKG